MSGYDDRRSGNRGRRDSGRQYERSRDPRERSPSRGHAGRERGYEREESRGRFDDRRGTGGGYGGRHGGGSMAPPQQPSDSKLPALPTDVPVPASGRALPETAHMPKNTSGYQLMVRTNHFKVKTLPTIKIYEYQLLFSVPPGSQRPAGKSECAPVQREKALTAAARSLGSVFVFDGVSIGWSPSDLMGGRDELTQIVDLPDHRAERENQVELKIRCVGRVNVKSIVDRLMGQDLSLQKQVSYLNALFRDDPASRFITRPKGLQYFLREPGLFTPLQSTGGVLEALRGFHQSISLHFGQLSLNVDTATTAFWAPNMSLIKVMMALAGLGPESRPEDMSRVKEEQLREVSERMRGLNIYTTHGPERLQGKKHKVKGLHTGNAINATFMQNDRSSGEARETSVADYFFRTYNIRLQHATLPLVETRNGLFPPELCRTQAGERYREVLEGKETADFIKFATAPAHVRSQQVVESVKRLEWHNKPKPAAHGISVSPQMMEVRALRLQPPVPEYAPGSQPTQVNNGAWNLMNKGFLSPMGFANWGAMYMPLASRRGMVSEHEIENFMRLMTTEFRKYGIKTPNSAPAMLLGNVDANIRDLVRNLVATTSSKSHGKPDLLFVFIHDGVSTMIYKALKTCSESEYGIPMQVLKVEKSIRGKGQGQYCGNVAMKVNNKLGGINSMTKEQLFQSRRFMMVGADVSHPTPAQLRSDNPPPSVAALTASLDKNCVRYTGIASPQPATQELINGGSMPAFAGMFDELLGRFKTANHGQLPQAVVYWRDGVADSQEEALLAGEVRSIQEKLGPLGIKLTVVNCVKRHHTRFFPINPNDGDRKLGNILPGTVVESGPKSAFVVGHGALQGTVRPTHYRILLDENKLEAAEFHRLILQGTYTYGKATRAVHIHSAVFYADIVAERSTVRLRQSGGDLAFVDVHSDMKSLMWWM